MNQRLVDKENPKILIPYSLCSAGAEFLSCGSLIPVIRRLQEQYQRHCYLPPGLPNPSDNICFLNSLLQGLSSLCVLRHVLNRLNVVFKGYDDTVIRLYKRADSNRNQRNRNLCDALAGVLGFLNNDGDFTSTNNIVKFSTRGSNLPMLEKCLPLKGCQQETLIQQFHYLRDEFERQFERRRKYHQRLEKLGQQDVHEALHGLLEFIDDEIFNYEARNVLRCRIQSEMQWRMNPYNIVQRFAPGIFENKKYVIGCSTNSLSDATIPFCLCSFWRDFDRSSHVLQQLQRALSGIVRYETKCVVCQWTSTCYNTKFLTLELPLESSGVTNLIDQLKICFLDPNIVDGVNCPNCFLNGILRNSIVKDAQSTLNYSEGNNNEPVGAIINNNNETIKQRTKPSDMTHINPLFLEEIELLQRKLLIDKTPWETILESSYELQQLARCRKMTQTRKINRCVIESFPYYLTIHIQRYNWTLGYPAKNSAHVRFPPLLNLDFLIHSSTSKENDRVYGVPHLYELRAVLEHTGNSISGGHFQTYRRWDCEISPFEASLRLLKRGTFTSNSHVHEKCSHCRDFQQKTNSELLSRDEMECNTDTSFEAFELSLGRVSDVEKSLSDRTNLCGIRDIDVKYTPQLSRWKWVCASDIDVRPVSSAFVMSRQAYILHYQKWYPPST